MIQKIFLCSKCAFQITRWVEPQVDTMLEWCPRCNRPRWFHWKRPETHRKMAKITAWREVPISKETKSVLTLLVAEVLEILRGPDTNEVKIAKLERLLDSWVQANELEIDKVETIKALRG